jgi:hypothetical protein
MQCEENLHVVGQCMMDDIITQAVHRDPEARPGSPIQKITESDAEDDSQHHRLEFRSAGWSVTP